MAENQPAPDPDYQRRESREGMLGLFEQTGEHCYLEAARELFERGDELTRRDILFLVESTDKNPTGRPPIDDADALMKMAGLVVMRHQTVWSAACEMAGTNPGYSKGATARRLARKYRTVGRDYEGVYVPIIRVEKLLRDVENSPSIISMNKLLGDADERFARMGLNPVGLPAVELMKYAEEQPHSSPRGVLTGLNLEGPSAAQFIRDYRGRVRRSRRGD